MDEPEREDPQQPDTGPPADSALAEAAVQEPVPPARDHRLRSALVSRATGWVVAVALAGAVVALSAVLVTTPRGLQVRALAGPVAITAIPAPGAVTGPGQVRIHAVPVPRLWALCKISTGPWSVRVARQAAPGGKPVTAIIVGPGKTRPVPIVACPAG
jgi:hypothetical protein